MDGVGGVLEVLQHSSLAQRLPLEHQVVVLPAVRADFMTLGHRTTVCGALERKRERERDRGRDRGREKQTDRKSVVVCVQTNREYERIWVREIQQQTF